MKHLFNKLSAFIVMLMCVSATAQADHEVCAPTLSSRGFSIMCWEDSETGKYYTDPLKAYAFSIVDYYNRILYLNLPKNPATNTAGFNLSDESEHWKYSAKYDLYDQGLDGTEIPAKYIEYAVRGDKVSNARIVWDTDNPGSGYKYNVKIYVNNNQVYIESGEVNGFYIANISNVKPNDVIKFEVKPLFQSMEGSYSANFHARLQYTYECDHEYSVGSHECSKCGYILAGDAIHHEVCDPTLSTRGFKHECWELDGKFYSNAACTNELQDKELAQTVVYAKLPASPVTSTSEFTQSEHENDWSVDFNWAAKTTFQDAKTNTYTTPRYAEFTATREEVSNARLVWMRSHGDVVNGKYTVKIYVNGTEKFSVDQNDNKNVEGVFVQPLPELKKGDVVKFEVTPNAPATWYDDDPDPTFKASLEYNLSNTVLTANEDPDNESKYYTTFYDSHCAYTLPQGVKAYTATIENNDGEQVVKLNNIEGNILPKGEAVLLYSDVSGEMTLTPTTEAADGVDGNAFRGVDVETTQEDYGDYHYYMLSYGQNGLGFYEMNADKPLAAHKAFLPLSDDRQAKSMLMVFADDNEVDGIGSINDDDTLRYDDDNIYSVSGVRLNKLQKGINIVNGKKVIVK